MGTNSKQQRIYSIIAGFWSIVFSPLLLKDPSLASIRCSLLRRSSAMVWRPSTLSQSQRKPSTLLLSLLVPAHPSSMHPRTSPAGRSLTALQSGSAASCVHWTGWWQTPWWSE